MSQLDLDHWENNLVARIEAAERRLEDLERLALIEASGVNSVALDVSVGLAAGQDVSIDDQSMAFSRAVGAVMVLPGLRGFWPMTAIAHSSSDRCRDVSGNGNHLTANNAPSFGNDGLIPYVALDGSNQDLTKADGGAGNWADITAVGVTVGGWFRPDGSGAGRLMSKLGAAGQISYELQISATPAWRMVFSDDGTNTDVATDSTNYTAGAWHFVVGVVDVSTDVKVFVNGNWSRTTTARASIFDSTSDFHIGSQSTSANYYDGRASMCFLCAGNLADGTVSALFNQTRGLFGV